MKMRGFWTKETCKEVALKYESKKDFKLNYPGAFDFCKRNKCLDEVTLHMKSTRKPKGYWTKERCEEVAKLCYKRSEFGKIFSTAYKISTNNNWLDEICSHMIVLGNLKTRLIYMFEFTDKSVYIGLTCDINRREKEHLYDEKLNSIVYRYRKETGFNLELKLLTDYLELEKAIELEKYYINFYKKRGYKLLNKKRGGEIGQVDKTIWNYDNCKRESLKYKSKTEFHDKKNSAYKISILNGWIDDFYNTISKKLVLDYNICKEESFKYKNRSEFRKSRTIYNFSSKNKWLDDFYPKNNS